MRWTCRAASTERPAPFRAPRSRPARRSLSFAARSAMSCCRAVSLAAGCTSPTSSSAPPGWPARGAVRSGAGLVTIASPRAALAVNAAASLAVMVRPVEGATELTAFLSDPQRNVVVLGPGGGVGREMQEMVLAALAADCAVVLDADALTSFCEHPKGLLAAIETHSQAATVLTP